MTWQVEFTEPARRELRALDRQVQRDILRYMRDRISTEEDPRRFGRALTGDRLGLWRYRIGDYRVICSIEEDKVLVLVLHVGHRCDVYER